MAEDFCKNFKGGWCPAAKSHVPRSWCFARCKERKAFPGMAKMAVEFAKQSAKYIAANRPKREPEEVERIKQICEDCDEHNAEKKRCYLCGCRIDIKMTWATTRCPLKKWET